MKKSILERNLITIRDSRTRCTLSGLIKNFTIFGKVIDIKNILIEKKNIEVYRKSIESNIVNH